MKAFDKVLRIGEGKILRQLEGIAKLVNSIEDDFVDHERRRAARPDGRLQAAGRER